MDGRVYKRMNPLFIYMYTKCVYIGQLFAATFVTRAIIMSVYAVPTLVLALGLGLLFGALAGIRILNLFLLWSRLCCPFDTSWEKSHRSSAPKKEPARPAAKGYQETCHRKLVAVVHG